jgi:MoxR-like ATPase
VTLYLSPSVVEARRPQQPAEESDAAAEAARRLLSNIERVVVGKPDEVALVVAAFISGGHVLLEDVPGTAKTILARAFAQTIEGTAFARIQCTPDLQPTEVTGLSIFNQKSREFEFRAGPRSTTGAIATNCSCRFARRRCQSSFPVAASSASAVVSVAV